MNLTEQLSLRFARYRQQIVDLTEHLRTLNTLELSGSQQEIDVPQLVRMATALNEVKDTLTGLKEFITAYQGMEQSMEVEGPPTPATSTAASSSPSYLQPAIGSPFIPGAPATHLLTSGAFPQSQGMTQIAPLTHFTPPSTPVS
jgi:hypothetical protein